MDVFGFGEQGWGPQFLAGMVVTIKVALLALPIGFVLGLACALMRLSSGTFVRLTAAGCATTFQAVPELLTIFAIYHGGAQLVQFVLDSAGIDAGWTVPGIVAGSLALGLVFAAYSSEVWIGALSTVGGGQHEAAKSLGLGDWATFRLVIYPQALRLALPGLGNLWLVLLKDTALVSLISVTDFMRQVNLAVAATRQPFSLYLFACIVYVAITMLSTLALMRFEEKQNAYVAGRIG